MNPTLWARAVHDEEQAEAEIARLKRTRDTLGWILAAAVVVLIGSVASLVVLVR